MKIVYFALVMLSVLPVFFLSSCKDAPATIDKSGIKAAENAGEALAREQLDAEKLNSDSEETENYIKQRMDEASNKIIKEYQEGDRRILYNADVHKASPLEDKLFLYSAVPAEITDVLCQKIISAFFKENAQNVVFEERLPGYVLTYGDSAGAYFTFTTVGNTVKITDHAKQLAPFENNRYTDKSDLPIGITANEAKKLCKQFLSDIGFYQYECNTIDLYGKQEGEEYYSIGMSLRQDGLAVSSNTSITTITFLVTTDGISEINGKLSGLTAEKELDNVISLITAMSIFENELDKITAFYDLEGYFAEYLDETGCMLSYPISEIAFEYVCKRGVKGRYSVVPAWRFLIGKEEFTDSKRVIAVDAVTGEMIF